jgi:hypothetical protein
MATISTQKARVALVFIHHSAKMDVEEAVYLWVFYQRMKRRRQRFRKYWVHPILRNRLTTSLYVTLYPSLRNYEPQFFNYFRMSIKSFDNLLELIKEEIKADANAILCILRRALTRADKVPGVKQR